MKEYITYLLLGLLLALVYQKPVFFTNISGNKLLKIVLILLNAYIANTYGMMNAVITSLIIIVLLHHNEGFKEGAKPSKKEIEETLSKAKEMLNQATETISKQDDDGDEETADEKADRKNGYGDGDNGWRTKLTEKDKKGKETFVSKIHIWHPAEFSGPCQIDLDRHLKIKSERANFESTKQLNGHTNDGFKIPQKQLY
tara:strand:+ start:1282 stop:1878 length:597 start_codon:yes stop_codon:yes gene_type:complete